MAYGNPYYFPQNYYQNMQGMPMQNNQQAVATSGPGITWVQGETAAKAYPVASGQSVLLMDSEASAFYIKSTDQSGMPQPLRIFDYKERTATRNEPAVAPMKSEDFISRKEFEDFKNSIQKTIKSIEEGEG